MTLKQNIKSILECHFSGFKDELIEACVQRIMKQIERQADTPQGEWIEVDEPIMGNPYCRYRCSECGLEEPYTSDFCPNCGAQMKGIDDEEDRIVRDCFTEDVICIK